MASIETTVLKKIMLALSDRVVLWRNNRGVATQGARKIRFGVGPNGASDLIGYREVVITPEMVGQQIAQFVAVEVKKPGEKPEPEQYRFIDAVAAAGGIAGWADSVEMAEGIFSE